MLKELKISSKKSIFVVLIFNLMILVSYIIFLFINFGLISNQFFFLALPSKIINDNIIFLVLFFTIEGFFIIYYFINKQKMSKHENNSEESYSDLPAFEIEDQEFIDNDISLNIKEVENLALPSTIENLKENILLSKTIDNDYKDLSPTFLPKYEVEVIKRKSGSKEDSPIKKQISIKKPESLLNDFQYAFYQKVVDNIWLFEKSVDRNRIAFEKNAIDEANINLSDINFLIQKELIFKVKIPHPNGSFYVYSIKKEIRNTIIKEITKSFLLKNRISIERKRYEIQNWKEIGLSKNIWEFAFSIRRLNLIGSVLTNDNYKEEIKGLIAVNELKLNSSTSPFIIVDNNDLEKNITKLIKTTGWGNITTFNFSSDDFFVDFIKYLNSIKPTR